MTLIVMESQLKGTTPGSGVHVQLKSSFFGKPTEMELDLSVENFLKLDSFLRRRSEGQPTKAIQEELTFLPRDQLEFFITGASPEAWEELFGNPEAE